MDDVNRKAAMPEHQGERQQGTDYRLMVPLLLHGCTVQTVTGLLRVTTSYRVLELDLSVVWLGAISATFAILPVFLAVFVGRFIDSGRDAQAARIGSALMLTAAAGLRFLSISPSVILAFTAVLGVGHLFLMAAHQMLCVRCTGDRGREAMFGNFLVASGIGQGLGPFIVGWIGGGATVPDTHLLFTWGLASTGLLMGISLLLPSAPDALAKARSRGTRPVRDLMRIHGFLTVLIASVVTITAQDLVVVYLPLLGTERSIDSSHIGMLLTVRSGAAIVSRLGYARLILAVGRVPLTVWSMVVSALSYVALALPLPLALMYPAAVVMGLGLGIATTLSLTSVLDIVPADARATALSLRITGNRIGQVSLPFLASFIATAAGAPGVLAVIGLSLAVSGISVYVVRRHHE